MISTHSACPAILQLVAVLDEYISLPGRIDHGPFQEAYAIAGRGTVVTELHQTRCTENKTLLRRILAK